MSKELRDRPAPPESGSRNRPAHSLTSLMNAPQDPAGAPGAASLSPTELRLLGRITERAFAQTQAMIWHANHREKRSGDPKVGGHPASCASSIHILGALHLAVREPADYVCCKPHASPVDHAMHNLLALFKHEDGTWFTAEESAQVMYTLRAFKTVEHPEVFQSYHARTDPDSFHFLPSGSVGIPPVVSVYLALAYRYAKDHGWNVPENAHFWSLIGDSEFREGSLLECLPDVSERHLGNVTWIIDYNRQNLDGTRIPNQRGLSGADCDRIEATAIANGWKVVQLRHGALRESLFARDGGAAWKRFLENGLTDFEYQMLLLGRDAAKIRARAQELEPACKPLLRELSDTDVLASFEGVGGHDLAQLVATFAQARTQHKQPTLVIAHTIKGWGLECFADPSNHSTLPDQKEVIRLLEASGCTSAEPFRQYAADSEEGRFLAARSRKFRDSIEAHRVLRERNRAWVREQIEKDGSIPESLQIDLSLFPLAHTQWMWGQLASKLVRIGTADEGGPQMSGGKDLTQHEQRWKTAADFVLTLSPDVGTSTNVSPVMDQRIYGPEANVDDSAAKEVRHPSLVTHEEVWTRHIRFEIAEANCMSAAASFGKMAHYTGLPFFPMMTVYDFFIKRALDQLYYNLYWGAEFVIMGTPSGVTLAPEGAQHSWKSDIQIPNLITWEPLFALEVDWILSDAIKRHMEDRNDSRRGVLIRAVTRAIPQKLLLDSVRTHAKSKVQGSWSGALAPKDAGWADATDESLVATLPDSDLLARVREECLAGAYYLLDWRGYAGYEPGDNVVQLFAMGSVATEAVAAAHKLLARGIFANVIVISSPELLLGILGEHDGYAHLRHGLGIDGDLHAVAREISDESELVGLAARRVPIVAMCDGEAGLVDNIGSIVGVKQVTLAVRKFSKCGRPDQVFELHHLDADSVVEACGKALSETALEDLRVSRELLERLAGRGAATSDWRELWPDAGSAH
ncbi:MAG: pyruvate dehydrogenase [Planctomycetes bacterium]|nr:pyruvate dehydrogenase [Planctomycetota bacterium]